MKEYVVVHESGYVGEYDVAKFSSFDLAYQFMKSEYTEEYIDEFHVNITIDIDGERSYEF
jgi:hypothetical protein